MSGVSLNNLNYAPALLNDHNTEARVAEDAIKISMWGQITNDTPESAKLSNGKNPFELSKQKDMEAARRILNAVTNDDAWKRELDVNS